MMKIICPECGIETENLIRHMRKHNKDIKDRKSFFRYYPDYDGAFCIDKRKREIHICPECGKTYSLNNCMMSHIKKEHPELYKTLSVKETRCMKFKCPICGKSCGDIKQHVELVHCRWDEFCEKYGWDPSLTKYVDDEYRRNLSNNKKKFYHSTDRGLELRKSASDNWKKSNPSKDRKIIAKAILNRTLHDGIPTENGRGVKIQTDNYMFRSLNEFEVYTVCKKFGIELRFEPNDYVCRYWNSEKNFMSTYLPDFWNPDIGLIELKSSVYEVENARSCEKYQKVFSIYKNLNIPYGIYIPEQIYKTLGINVEHWQINDILKDEFCRLRCEKTFHIWCESFSRRVKKLLDCDDLETLDFVTLRDIQNKKL